MEESGEYVMPTLEEFTKIVEELYKEAISEKSNNARTKRSPNCS